MIKDRFFGLIALLLCFLCLMGCGSKAIEANGITSETVTGVEATPENPPQQVNLETYVSEQYGFSFRYGALILDDTIDGDQFVKLEDELGNSATVTISKPDELIGDDPEAWLKEAFISSDYKIVRRENTTLSSYPALLVEFTWEVLGKPVRTIEWIALKDEYFFQLVVTMKEETVKTSRKAFDEVVDSFSLLDTLVNLEAQKPWLDKIPKDYPFEIVDLYGLSELTSVFGTEISASKLVTIIYDLKKDISYEEAVKYFSDALKDAQGLDVSPHSEKTNIEGIQGGFDFDIEVRSYKTLGKTTVSIAIKKANE